MVDDALLLDSEFVILVVYLVLRLEIPRMSSMSTPFFYTRFIGLKVPDLTPSVIESGSQPSENY